MNTEQVSASADIVGVAGQRANSQLLNNRRTARLKVRVSCGVNITVAGAGIRNKGSVLSLFDTIGLDAGGTDKQLWDPRAARFFSELNSPSALPATRLATANVQNVTLTETLYVFCANPRIALPMETSFLEENTRNVLQLFAQFNGDATKLVNGGTVALTNPLLRIQQEYDDRRAERPVLLPFARQLSTDVPGANNALRIDLRGSRYLGALVIQQDTSIGEVDDIINSLVLRGDGREIIGPRAVPWSDLVDHMAADFGGSVSGAVRPYWCYNFLRDGRLSKLLHPAAYSNLRLEVDCQPSVTAGAAASKIKVTMLEYEPHPDLTLNPLPFEI